MQAAAAGTGVRLSDGSTNVLPVGDADDGRQRLGATTTGWCAARWSAASTRAGTCTRPSCRRGTPRRTPSTARALPARSTGSRPTPAHARAAIADEPATARALAAYLLRGVDCGAVDEAEVLAGVGLGDRPLSSLTVRATQESRAWRNVLGANQYGKAENRVVRIVRDTPRHEIRDLNVSTSLRGDFGDAHATGDQAQVLPTDTQKNTAFAYAKLHGVASIEDYALALGGRLLEAMPGRERGAGAGRGVRLGPARRPLVRTPRRRGPHLRGHRRPRRRPHVLSGLQDLVVLNSTDSEFKGFLKDEFTTLPETDDRILATSLVAKWRHAEHRRRLERVVRRGPRLPALDLRHDLLPRAPGDAAR